MTSAHNDHRLKLARTVAADICRDPRIVAALLTGSVARGLADDSSDVDIMFYYHTLPSQAEFEAIRDAALAAGGGLYGGNHEEGFALYTYVDGIRVDQGHGRLAETTELIDTFLTSPTLDEENILIVIHGLSEGIPLYGQDMLAAWQERLRHHYPDTLRHKLVEKHLRFAPQWVLTKMGADRDDVLFVYDNLLKSANNLIGILCGLNAIYHPGKVKSIEQTTAKMTMLPANFTPRLKQIFHTNLHQAVADLYSLIDETLALVDTHMPAINTDSVRHRIAMELRK